MTVRDPQTSGLAYLQELIGTTQGLTGIGQTIGMRLTKADKGFAVFEATPDERCYNLIGTAHGGYIATLLDAACGGATQTMMSAGQAFSTIELKVSYHRAITKETGPIRAEGRIVSIGRRVSFAEAALLDANDKLLASATSTLLIVTPEK